MERFRTLIDALESAAANTNAKNGYIFINKENNTKVSFKKLQDDAKFLAGGLQAKGIAPGDRLLLVLPTGSDFARAFYGALYCGAIPCVVAAPASTGNIAEGIERIQKIARHLDAKYLITNLPESAFPENAGLQLPVLTLNKLDAETEGNYAPVSITGNSVAFIQATSGSTGTPKCVMIRHRNALANLAQIAGSLKIRPDDVVVSWLPLFHDMGLVGCFLFTLYNQIQGVFLKSTDFLRRPESWLQAISKFRGTLSPAPNFAYALVAARARNEVLETLDLSSWRSAMCGAEPVEANTLALFTKRFRTCGFSEKAFLPCYGMAEATLAITMYPADDVFRFERVSYRELTEKGVASVDIRENEPAVDICDCGPVLKNTRVSIVDDRGNELADGYVGHIRVSGPSVMMGYFNHPEKTARALKDDRLITGDLGYLRNGRLFVTGRAKDLIIIRGQKFQPGDFEKVAASVGGISRGRVVAFGVSDAAVGTEGLTLVCEMPRNAEIDLKALQAAVRDAVAAKTGVFPAHVGFVPRNAIPRTTSGKLQRNKAKQLYLEYLKNDKAA